MDNATLHNYNAVLEGCGLMDLPDHALLWAAGRDRIDLIHRMSTNDLTNMAENEGRATVLTTPLARIVDRIIVINLEPKALVLGSANMATTIRRWLSGYIFFQDDVALADASSELAQFRLFGPKADSIIERLMSGASALKLHHARRQGGAIIGRADSVAGSSFFVAAEKTEMAQWRAKAVEAGAIEADPAVYNILRVEAGLPEMGHEMGEDFIPLESGLWNDVSFTKGCYIGQEIIARMESRGKLAKRLIGLKAASPLTPGGLVTSAVESPRFGWIGLGFAKPSDEIGSEIVINGARATIAALPFQG
ncbi:MAG: hypothetical protein HYZ49_11920 [Chloroflexi bacterium]|nr:hypothetical protein [Chloroflexota bacterium]